MILDSKIAKKIAQSLLQIKAIILQPNNPFTWASGWNSPIYCDNRITLSYPQLRTYITKELTQGILKKFKKPDAIAGVATGAIAQGALVAKELEVPFIYVRSDNKKHGRQNLIEGKIEEGKSIVVIEDLISSGKSSLYAVNALRKAQYNVVGMAAIFTYGFVTAKQNFIKNNCELFTLGNYKSLIEEALESNYISKEEFYLLKKWHKDPGSWRND